MSMRATLVSSKLLPVEPKMKLLLILGLHRTRRRFRFCWGAGLNRRVMNAASVSDEGNRDQEEHYDQDDALFVFGKLKNPEQALHFVPARNRSQFHLARLAFRSSKNPAVAHLRHGANKIN